MQRRTFLQYIGAGTAALFAPCPVFSDSRAFLREFRSPPYPLPLPGDGGSDSSDAVIFKEYKLQDQLSIPEEYVSSSIVSWGDLLGKEGCRIRVGYNCDHLSLFPRKGVRGEYFLIVNHEYVSVRPWTESVKEICGSSPPEFFAFQKSKKDPVVLRSGDMLIRLNGLTDLTQYPELSREIERLSRMILDEMGVSIIHLKREGERLLPIADSTLHRRISSDRRVNIAPSVTFRFRGPGAAELGVPLGTLANCSGATTPWGTALSCEENFQTFVEEWVRPDGKTLNSDRFRFGAFRPHPETGLPLEWTGLGSCLAEPLDPRHYGWVCEVDPESGALEKFTNLGRFRHENVALDCRSGKRLRAYMGDDRRGGHIWRFESEAFVRDPLDRSNGSLLERGTLSVARFNSDYSGDWIPLKPNTPLAFPEPEQMADGFLPLPNRPAGGPVLVSRRPKKELLEELEDNPFEIVTPEEWCASVERFTGKTFSQITLGDLVLPSGSATREYLLLLDAFLMANACGGTPSARPEDLEVHPRDCSIFVAFTDATGSDEGSPDRRIFPDSERVNSRQYGAIYRIEESEEPRLFRWGKFLSSGEVADGGASCAAIDNLTFDSGGNLFFATDISPEVLNTSVTRSGKTAPGKKYFPGIFGNSALFLVRTSGSMSGVPKLFATGPMESELTGIMFYSDDSLPETLFLSVQHPGEDSGVSRGKVETREYQVRTRGGSLFRQKRTVPIGSAFPHDSTKLPRPTVYSVRPKVR